MLFRPKPSPLKSVIDAFDGGVLRGWIYNPSTPLSSECFYIELNGRRVKECVAENYRSDLERAGMGNGCHGFSVDLSPFQLKYGKNSLRLLDLSKRVIRNTTKEFIVEVCPLKTVCSQTEPYMLRFDFTYDEPILNKDRILRLYVEGRQVAEYDLEPVLNGTFLNIPLPVSVLDEKTHSLSLGLSGYTIALWSNDKFRPKTLELSPYFSEEDTALDSNSKRVLFVDSKYPNPTKDAGSTAAINELNILKSLGYLVYFISDTNNEGTVELDFLRSIGVECISPSYHIPIEKLVKTMLKNSPLAFDFIYINRFSIAERLLPIIKNNPAKTPVVLNLADLHFLREIRNGLSSNRSDKLDQARDTQKRELDVINKVDAVLTYTSEEKAVICSHLYRQEHIHIAPWVLEKKENIRPFFDREGVAFIGGYSHEPNIEALEYIVNTIAPALYKLKPEINFYLYGSNLPEKYRGFEIPNVKFVGYIDNVFDLYDRHRVFIAPLLSGAGIKGKVLESISYSLPTVLSDIAAEGISTINNVNTLVANSHEEWVSQIFRLYEDEDTWQRISRNQREMIRNQFSFDEAKKQFKKIFSVLNKESQ